eukprot:3273938-Ditylum_brightwellii.AAC.1
MAEVYCNKFDVDEDVQNLTKHHPRGFPVYSLDAHLHDRSGSDPKWDPRARLGINLGLVCVHAGNVRHSPSIVEKLVESNGADLKGTLSESSWELPDEAFTMPSLLQQPSNDTNVNEETQPLSQSVNEPVALAPVLSPSLSKPSQLPAVNEGEN